MLRKIVTGVLVIIIALAFGWLIYNNSAVKDWRERRAIAEKIQQDQSKELAEVLGVDEEQGLLNEEISQLEEEIAQQEKEIAKKKAFINWYKSEKGSFAALLCSNHEQYKQGRITEDVCMKSAFLRCKDVKDLWYGTCVGASLTHTEIQQAKALVTTEAEATREHVSKEHVATREHVTKEHVTTREHVTTEEEKTRDIAVKTAKKVGVKDLPSSSESAAGVKKVSLPPPQSKQEKQERVAPAPPTSKEKKSEDPLHKQAMEAWRAKNYNLLCSLIDDLLAKDPDNQWYKDIHAFCQARAEKQALASAGGQEKDNVLERTRKTLGDMYIDKPLCDLGIKKQMHGRECQFNPVGAFFDYMLWDATVNQLPKHIQDDWFGKNPPAPPPPPSPGPSSDGGGSGDGTGGTSSVGPNGNDYESGSVSDLYDNGITDTTANSTIPGVSTVTIPDTPLGPNTWEAPPVPSGREAGYESAASASPSSSSSADMEGSNEPISSEGPSQDSDIPMPPPPPPPPSGSAGPDAPPIS